MANPSQPVLNSPVSGVQVNDNTPSLSFTIPSDVDGDSLVFQIELDTNNPINPLSSDYKKFESRLGEGEWQYWNGSSYTEIPSAGISASVYGSNALFTVPNASRLRNAIWYWKVSVSDQLTGATFNNAIFGQNKFSS